jgi:hypothetical protein
MKSRSRCTLLAIVLVAAACDPDKAAQVTVNYKQVANFPNYRVAEGAPDHPAGEAMYVMYKVTTISNTGSKAKPFTFDPDTLVTVTQDTLSSDRVNIEGNVLLGDFDVSLDGAGAGQVKTVNKCFIMRVATSDPQALASTTAHVGLVYPLGSSQPVSMHNDAPNGTIAFLSAGLPKLLQPLCEKA